MTYDDLPYAESARICHTVLMMRLNQLEITSADYLALKECARIIASDIIEHERLTRQRRGD